MRNTALPVEFHEGDATKLAFADAFFDSARAERVLMHLREPRQGLEEMIRVVRSGGRIIASELDQETIFYDSPQVEVMRRLVTSLADATPSPWVGRSVIRLMRQVGLQNLRSQATMLNIPFSMIRIGLGGHVDKCVQQGVISP
jgi:ubiquinone/menaquinone biosynthesis C-methylase UbiE